MAGHEKSGFDQLNKEFQVRIHVLPFDGDQTSKDGSPDEIVLVGLQENCIACKERIESLYSKLSRTIRSLTISVPKKKHKYIVGQKSSNLIEIFKSTGCIVELPPVEVASDVITIKGPEAKLSFGLQKVLEKVSIRD